MGRGARREESAREEKRRERERDSAMGKKGKKGKKGKQVDLSEYDDGDDFDLDPLKSPPKVEEGDTEGKGDLAGSEVPEVSSSSFPGKSKKNKKKDKKKKQQQK